MIIWLASYPKSGNTWMRMFLKSYFMKSNEKFSLEGSILDSFKPQGFPDQGLLDKLKVDYHKFDEIVKITRGPPKGPPFKPNTCGGRRSALADYRASMQRMRAGSVRIKRCSCGSRFARKLSRRNE